MNRFDSVCEFTEYWASVELESGEKEKIEEHERYCDLDVDVLNDIEIISSTFESESHAQDFLEILEEILTDE